jgi:hypothetical protein
LSAHASAHIEALAAHLDSMSSTSVPRLELIHLFVHASPPASVASDVGSEAHLALSALSETLPRLLVAFDRLLPAVAPSSSSSSSSSSVQLHLTTVMATDSPEKQNSFARVCWHLRNLRHPWHVRSTNSSPIWENKEATAPWLALRQPLDFIPTVRACLARANRDWCLHLSSVVVAYWLADQFDTALAQLTPLIDQSWDDMPVDYDWPC